MNVRLLRQIAYYFFQIFLEYHGDAYYQNSHYLLKTYHPYLLQLILPLLYYTPKELHNIYSQVKHKGDYNEKKNIILRRCPPLVGQKKNTIQITTTLLRFLVNIITLRKNFQNQQILQQKHRTTLLANARIC